MKRFYLVFFFSFLMAVTMQAQGFAEHLESTQTGQGRVTLIQDERLTAILNGQSLREEVKKDEPFVAVKNEDNPLKYYTSFDSPHWRCRVGDFITREEANKYLSKLRRISKDAMIVRSEIFVYQ